ncbi:MAG: hypothetical protein ACYC35_12925 [Pirellulales bacterium]
MNRSCTSTCNPCSCGECLKANALADLEARRGVYVLRARRAMLSAMILGDGTANADDVRADLDLPKAIDARCLGSVPTLLARLGIIEAAGFVRSERPERHASYIQVWKLANRPKAIAWLADNLDVPDDDQADPPTVQTSFLFQNPQYETSPTVAAAGLAMEN